MSERTFRFGTPKPIWDRLFGPKDDKLRWIPCAERMPEYGAPVLAWALWDDDELSETYGATGLVWVAQLDHSGDWLQRDSRLDFRVTHWMPLPEGPEVKG